VGDRAIAERDRQQQWLIQEMMKFSAIELADFVEWIQNTAEVLTHMRLTEEHIEQKWKLLREKELQRGLIK
jgi:hypothetical protein